MNKLTLISASAIALMSFAGHSQAQTIVGVQFPSFYSGPYNQLNGSKYGAANYTAGEGAYAVNNWNVAVQPATAPGNGLVTAPITQANLVTYNMTTPFLMTSTGAASSATFSYNVSSTGTERGNGQYASFPGTDTNQQGDSNLASGGAFNYGGSSALTFGGLVATDDYNVVAYLSFDYYGTVVYGGTPPYNIVEASLGGTNYFAASQSQSNLTGWTQVTDTTGSNPTLGNYVEFDGISGAALAADSLTLNNSGGLSGFQLIDTGAIPEPSTWAMMLGGLGVLAFGVRRKSALQK